MKVVSCNGGTRSFILVQIPELLNNEYSNICEVGEERIRRAGDTIRGAVEEANCKLNLDENGTEKRFPI